MFTALAYRWNVVFTFWDLISCQNHPVNVDIAAGKPPGNEIVKQKMLPAYNLEVITATSASKGYLTTQHYQHLKKTYQSLQITRMEHFLQ